MSALELPGNRSNVNTFSNSLEILCEEKHDNFIFANKVTMHLDLVTVNNVVCCAAKNHRGISNYKLLANYKL